MATKPALPLCGRPVRTAGFTLSEMLTVLAVLVVLIAVLTPAFLNARARSQTTTCASNLRQVGAALAQYVADNDGTFPPSDMHVFALQAQSTTSAVSVSRDNAPSWYDLLAAYSPEANALVCPLVRLPDPTKRRAFAGYAYNSGLDEKLPLPGRRHRSEGKSESAVRHPSMLVTVFEARHNVTAANGPDSEYGSRDSAEERAETLGAVRHRGGANYLFADGHVRRLTPDAVQCCTDAKPDGTRPTFLP